MRIAIVAPPWVPVPPPAYGGTEGVIDSLARGFEVAGHDVLLFATGDSTCPVPTRWVRSRAAGTAAMAPGTELHHVTHAYREVSDWGADIVHDHTLSGPLFSDRFGLAVVTTNHGPFDSELGDYYREIGRSVPVIAISGHHASTAAAAGIPVRAIIHHGVDVDSFPEGTGEGGYALFLGRMSPDKGVHVAARVARRAGVPLRIAAKMHEPAERAYFESAVAPLLGEGVEYVGEVGGKAKLEMLADAVCLLNPIQWPEPFGMVMIESLACGTPVVATPFGAAPELVTHLVTGCIAEAEDEMVEALRQISSLDRAQCRKEAAKRFSTERMVSDHIDLYSEILSEAARRGGDRASPG